MTIRVGVFGAGGRMGAIVCNAVAADPQLQLVATVDPHHAGIDLRQVAKVESPDLQVAATPDEFVRQGVEVAVDFTVLEAARGNLEFLAENGIHAVVGTTGFGKADYQHLKRIFTRSNCLIAPNFAIGSVLLERFAAIAAPYFQTRSVVEVVPVDKPDEPSAAATTAAHNLTGAPEDAGASATVEPHTIRHQGLPGRLEVMLGTAGQWLSIRHDSSGDTMFMPGVLLGVKLIGNTSGLTIGLDTILGL